MPAIHGVLHYRPTQHACDFCNSHVYAADIDCSRYNQPTTDEVAAIYVGDDGSPALRDFFSNDGKVRAIPIISPHCDPMTYTLLFPFGHLGWQMRMPRITANRAPNSRADITLREHYLIHISIRDQNNAIYRGRGLFQQFLVDAYCKVDSNNLNVYRAHQN